MKTIITIATLLLLIGCTHSQIKAEKKETTSHNLIKVPPNSISKSNTLWVTINGKKEEFKGDAKSIKTFDDCKKAGFKILKKRTETCMMGEPYMTNGNYRTFTNNPMESGTKCTDYTNGTCPHSCVAKCKSSSCIETKYGIACTDDCDGAGSCVER